MSATTEFIRVNSNTGHLLIESPPVDQFNLTLNISLACFTTAIRESNWSNFSNCFSIVFSLFSLQRFRIYGWPLQWIAPWESDTVLVNDGAQQIADTLTEDALHHEEEDTHTHPNSLLFGGFDLLWFFLFIGFFALLLGTCAGDRYTIPAEEYRGIKTGETAAV